ncbi:MAG: hypothetical protein AAF658_15845, partial [Myxococcota bacterium]
LDERNQIDVVIPSVAAALSLPDDAEALVLLDMHTGEVNEQVGEFPSLESVATLAHQLYLAEALAAQRLGMQSISEMVLTTGKHWTLVRSCETTPPQLAVLVFDPTRATLVMERRGLGSVLDTFVANFATP